jgi:hypothetical protein
MAVHAGCLMAAAATLESTAHAAPGRFGAEAVERAVRSGDPVTAAESVAEAFLGLSRPG